MKTPFLLSGLALALALVTPARAAVYFAAHQDDIVLLMGRNAQLDIKGDRPTVLVVLTAGDGGNGNAAVNLAGLGAHYYNQIGNPYFRVRHNAHEAAIARLPAAYSRIPQRSTEYFGAGITAVEKVRMGNVVIYNLNLPDGELDRLEKVAPAPLDDITGTNHYLPESLRDTLRQIVARHARESAGPTVHVPEHSPGFSVPSYNDLGQVARISDHRDHTAAGRLVRDGLAADGTLNCLRRVVYMGYAIAALPDAMSAAERLSQAKAYHALNAVLKNQVNMSFDAARQNLHLGSMDNFHTSFFGKQNTREEVNAACRPALPVQTEASRHARIKYQFF